MTVPLPSDCRLHPSRNMTFLLCSSLAPILISNHIQHIKILLHTNPHSMRTFPFFRPLPNHNLFLLVCLYHSPTYTHTNAFNAFPIKKHIREFKTMQSIKANYIHIRRITRILYRLLQLLVRWLSSFLFRKTFCSGKSIQFNLFVDSHFFRSPHAEESFDSLP